MVEMHAADAEVAAGLQQEKQVALLRVAQRDAQRLRGQVLVYQDRSLRWQQQAEASCAEAAECRERVAAMRVEVDTHRWTISQMTAMMHEAWEDGGGDAGGDGGGEHSAPAAVRALLHRLPGAPDTGPLVAELEHAAKRWRRRSIALAIRLGSVAEREAQREAEREAQRVESEYVLL